MSHPVDAGHATPELTELVLSLFEQKAAASAAGFMSHFARDRLTYTDATFGGQWTSHQALAAALGGLMATWRPPVATYPVKIIGDTSGAVVLFVNSAQLFGHELRVIAPLDLRDGKIERQVDYWDGRHFGTAATSQMRVPPDQYPAEFGESRIGERAPAVLRQVADTLAGALSTGDAAAAAALFTDDARFEDLTLHTAMVGRQAIGGFLDRARDLLPYGLGTSVRHVVGSGQGGAYEWRNTGAAVPGGVVALELDGESRISRLTTVWDGSLIDDSAQTALLGATVER
ncbi:nuclear transport factor 2 family protein [Microtetraspora malaysiensis]|uniref:nuclear transport factor 2 family protein n=1 Tax=Microtetraspora malaysiensis TaxID=161358 RepID=UPI00083339F9|nr:nuclear transport factor 2 family protein [Microtetraspora malaysiensis]